MKTTLNTTVFSSSNRPSPTDDSGPFTSVGIREEAKQETVDYDSASAALHLESSINTG